MTHDNHTTGSQRREEEMEKIIDNIHEMVNQYCDEKGFEDWCALRAYLRRLEVERGKKKMRGTLVDLKECSNFFDAVIATLRDYESRLQASEQRVKELEEALEKARYMAENIVSYTEIEGGEADTLARLMQKHLLKALSNSPKAP